jgi:hypothetical protein
MVECPPVRRRPVGWSRDDPSHPPANVLRIGRQLKLIQQMLQGRAVVEGAT